MYSSSLYGFKKQNKIKFLLFGLMLRNISLFVRPHYCPKSKSELGHPFRALQFLLQYTPIVYLMSSFLSISCQIRFRKASNWPGSMSHLVETRVNQVQGRPKQMLLFNSSINTTISQRIFSSIISHLEQLGSFSIGICSQFSSICSNVFFP